MVQTGVNLRKLSQNKAGLQFFGPPCIGSGQSAAATRKPTEARLAGFHPPRHGRAGPGEGEAASSVGWR